MKAKHNIFIRIIKDDKNYLKFKGNITEQEAGKIISYISEKKKL